MLASPLGDGVWGDGSATDPSIAYNAATQAAQQAASTGNWSATLQQILPTVATTVQQQQIFSAQMARAQAGLPPLDPSQFGLGVQVGVSPQLQSYLLYGALALGAILLMPKRK